MKKTVFAGRSLAAFGFAIALVFAAADVKAQQDPVAFLETLQSETLTELTDPSLDEAAKEKRAREIFQQNFDTPEIGRFVIGRYWRSASDQEKEDFLAVFEDVIIQRFVPLFEEQKDAKFVFGTARQDDKTPEMSLVSSELDTGKETVKVVWRVRETNGMPKVLDVIIEGASMALTLRSEYSSFIKSNGGKVANLTESLREKVTRGAFKGQVN